MRRVPAGLLGWAAAVLWCWSSSSAADPWLAPGDLELRSDIQLLADEGLVRTPVTSWPLSWADVVRDLESVRSVELRTPSLAEAYARVRGEARRNTRVSIVDRHAEIRVAQNPIRVRGFEDTPREDADLAGAVSWIGERFATRLAVRRVLDPEDGKPTRLDGSYVGMAVGNLMVSAGYMEKWWGPGWAGSLILSTNARPVPSITIERNFSQPFEVPVLRWIGPWRASFQAGRLEGRRSDYARPHFMALRIAFKPVPSLEVGVSRSAQLCGAGRECGFRTYWDMVVGNDNDQELARQPGNQLAGFDARWSLSRLAPVALYAQAIGEDEAGYLPSKYLGLAGLEAWGRFQSWRWRAYGEYARTSCNAARRASDLGCAYESSIYTDGYRYRRRSIGHAYDRDGSGWVLGLVASKDEWSVSGRVYAADLNRLGTGDAHTVSSSATRLRGVELGLTKHVRRSRLRIGIGYDDARESVSRLRHGLKASLGWQHAV